MTLTWPLFRPTLVRVVCGGMWLDCMHSGPLLPNLRPFPTRGLVVTLVASSPPLGSHILLFHCLQSLAVGDPQPDSVANYGQRTIYAVSFLTTSFLVPLGGWGVLKHQPSSGS
jgi:hypothetical protein